MAENFDGRIQFVEHKVSGLNADEGPEHRWTNDNLLNTIPLNKAGAPRQLRAELLNSKTSDVPLSALSSALPDSLLARAEVFGKATLTALPVGVMQSLAGMDHVCMPFSEKIFGKSISIPVPTILENAAIGATIGFAAKTLLPETGVIGKIGGAVLGAVFTAPLLSTGFKVINDTRLAKNVNDLQLAGSEFGSAVGSFAGGMPVGIASYKFGARMGSSFLASEPMLSFAEAKGEFCDKLNQHFDSGIDGAAALKNGLPTRLANDAELLQSLNRASAMEKAARNLASNPINLETLPAADASSHITRFDWGKSTAEGWNESNLIHVDTRKLLGQLTSVDGVGLRVGAGQGRIPEFTDPLINKDSATIGEDIKRAMQNPENEGMHPARRKQAVWSSLSYTEHAARELYGTEDPKIFQIAHGEMARSLTSEEVNNALTMYRLAGAADLNTRLAPQFMKAANELATNTDKDFAISYKTLAQAAPYMARRMGFISRSHDMSSIHSLKDLSEAITTMPGQSVPEAMQVILGNASKTLATMENNNVPRQTVMKPALAPEVLSALSHLAPNGLDTLAGRNALNAVAKNLSLTGVPRTAQAIEAMYSYENNGGNLNKLDSARVILATQAYNELGAAGVRPHVIEVALNQGYGNSSEGNCIPWSDLQKTAVHYQADHLRDYKLSGVVGQLVNNDIPVSKHNIQLALESIQANNGQMDTQHLHALIRVSEAVKDISSAPAVFDTFARAQAAELGINTNNMEIGDILRQLECVRGNLTANSLAQRIVNLARLGGGFSDHQLLDPTTVAMLLETGDRHPFTPQAINAVTKVLGSVETMNHPKYISVAEEYLDRGGKMKNLDMSTLQAAVALSEAREHAATDFSQSHWNNVKISPETIKLILRDPSYSFTDPTLNSGLIEKILRAANRGQQ